MDTSAYTNNPERLLTEIGFMGAQYGLYLPVMAIATTLGKEDKTRPASVLMLGVLNIALKNYGGARAIFQGVVDTKGYDKYVADAKAFLSIVDQVDPPKEIKKESKQNA